jgi:hypothetical protein
MSIGGTSSFGNGEKDGSLQRFEKIVAETMIKVLVNR